MKKILLLLIFTINIYSLYSEVKEKEEEEKKPIFSLDILSEDDFYLYLDGSWQFDLTTSAEGDISKLLDNIIFKQVPDFSASLWLFNKFFFEAEIREESEENLFLLGYQSSTGLFREVRIGNSDINIGEYAGYTPPINELRAPGARFKIATQNSTHEVLSRYTSEINDSIKFRGLNQIEEESLYINEYSTGQFLILPFTNRENVNLYYDNNGKLEQLNNQDYIYYKDRSLVYIINPNISKIFTNLNGLTQSALYNFIQPSNNPGIDSGTLSVDLWNSYVKSINGVDYIQLKNRGEYSPFEHLGVYELPENSTTLSSDVDILLNGSKVINYSLIDNFILFWDNNISYDNLKQRYPFIDLDSTIYGAGGSGLTSDSLLDFEILTPVETISIPTDAKKGSLTISINGVREYGFTHDSDTGEITFDNDISPFDEIVINYDTEIIPGTGNLLLSYGSSYRLADNLSLDLSQTGSWDFSTEDYSYEYNENRGDFSSKTRLKYDTENFEAELNNELGVSTPDSLGKYLIFEYNQGNISIPFNQTTIDKDIKGSVDLVSRELDDKAKSIDTILSSEIDPTGGAYYATHSYEKSNYKVIILESDRDLSPGESLLTSLDLGEYKDDYSFSREFKLDIYNHYAQERTLTIIFKNPGLDSSVTKSILLKPEIGYNEYKVSFTKSERKKLIYIEDIQFKLEESPKALILIKDLTFTGDSLVTNSSEKDLTIYKTDHNLSISQSGEDINRVILSSKINEIDIYKYNKLKFSVKNSGMIVSDLTLKFHYLGSPVATLVVPQYMFKSGDNDIEVNLASDSVTVNGSKGGSWTQELKGVSRSIGIEFDSSGSGELQISEIVLTEPKLEMFNRSDLTLTYKPDFSYKVNNFTIIDNIVLENSNSVTIDESTSYSGYSDLSLELFGSSIKSEIKYSEDIDAFNYKVEFPYKFSPITITDSFEYSKNSKRENGVNLKTKPIYLEILLSDYKTESRGLRENSLKMNLLQNLPINIKLNSKLQQSREDDLKSIDSEISKSYSNIVLEDETDEKNNFSSTLSLEFNRSRFNFEAILTGEFEQDILSKNIFYSAYELEVGPSIKFTNVTFNPGFNTNYSNKLDSRYTDDLSSGFYGYYDNFLGTNPYKRLNFNDMIFNSSYRDFYTEYDNSVKRDLKSDIYLNINLKKESYHLLNSIIPNSITISKGKEFSEDESKMITLDNIELEGEFLLHPVIKNSVSFKNSLNLENDETSITTQWSLKMLKEFTNKMTLEIKNDLNKTPEDISNLTTTDFTWPGRSGPVLVVPIINKIFDNPYQYIYKERLYLKVDEKDFDIGVRHDTTIKVKDMNETNFYVDVGYDTSTDTPLYFEAGVVFTLIF